MLPILTMVTCTVMFAFGVLGIPGLSSSTQLLLVLPVAMLFGMCVGVLMFLAEEKKNENDYCRARNRCEP